MPAARFATPETSGASLIEGEVRAEIQNSIGTSHKITLGEVYSLTVFKIDPTVTTGAKIERSFALGANAQFGLFKRLDVYYRLVHDSPDIAGLKFQFWGAPRSE